MISIKQSLLKSYKVSLIFGIITVHLLIGLTITIFIYSSNVQKIRVPNTLLSHNLITAINESTSLQKSWILMGDQIAREQRKTIWSHKIPDLASKIEQQLSDIENSLVIGSNDEIDNLKRIIENLKRLLVNLRDSQWWIDDISHSDGDSPSRVIYYRDVLPLYENLNGALEGLMYDKNYNSIESHELRISLIITHQHLSDGLRDLSEAIRTGAQPHINSFYRQSELFDHELLRFLKMAKNNGSSRPLLEWVITNYREYLKLARKSIENRLANDDNLSLYLFSVEAEPITKELNILLQNLIETESNFLAAEATQINQNLLLFLIMILIMFCVAFFINYRTTRKMTREYIQEINSLILASNDMVKGKQSTLNTHSQFEEFQNLNSAFLTMRNAVMDREAKLKEKQGEIEQLTHIVTHDMKPPIINIKGHAEIISDKIGQTSWDKNSFVIEVDLLRKTIEESLVYINKSAIHIGELVGRILTYAEWSTLVIDLISCDLKLIVNNVLAINSHRLKGSKTKLKGHLPIIDCDIFLLKTILSTIVDNAIKYAESGRPLLLEVEYQKVDGFHRISIKDNGQGIPSIREKSIYLLSGKYSGDASKVQDSFGIGLAGAKKLIGRVGGNLYHLPNSEILGSRIIVGTTFYVDFPILLPPFDKV